MGPEMLLALLAISRRQQPKPTSTTAGDATPDEPRKPQRVKLEAGKDYRIRLQVIESKRWLGPKFLAGIKQGLEAINARDVKLKFSGGRAFVSYVQTPSMETELQTGVEKHLPEGMPALTVVFVSARPVNGVAS